MRIRLLLTVATVVAAVAGAQLLAHAGVPSPKPEGNKDAPPPPPPAEPPKAPEPTDGMKTIKVKAGAFTMGGRSGEGEKDELPARQVTISKDFEMDSIEVTAKMFLACVKAGKCTIPNTGGKCTYGVVDREDHPVNCVDWSQAKAYCGFVGKRLPTEAEWEYAARGGLDGRKYPSGDDTLDEDGWYERNSDSQTHVGGKKKANGYGLFDLIGNVWEWCEDAWDKTAYAKLPATDPVAKGTTTKRVTRGGAWNYSQKYLRVSDRNRLEMAARNAFTGFRCVR